MRYLADWAAVYDRLRSRRVDLNDPFATAIKWRADRSGLARRVEVLLGVS